ncbi:aminotransferase class I/II-fold pyridoxal phosphate-dependent enzyme [bacterium]|nr:aminotransferase class I/II-fold pyridoxal phosphate-dependent enzyme [bacterium]
MAAGEPVLFDRNENRFGPAPACLEVLRKADTELLFNYTRAFRRGAYSDLSLRLAAMHGVDEHRIILGYGCEDILKEAVHHFVAPDEAVLIPSASWWYYTAIADEVGGITVQYPLIEEETTYRVDVDALIAQRERHAPALVLIASPNNPTGNRMPRADLIRVLEAYRDTPVVLDQAYFGLDPDEADDYAELVARFPRLVILRTFSKLFALAGVRIGYGITGTGLADFERFCARNLGYNRISERLALAALDSPDYYRDIARRMAADRERFYEFFRALPGCRIYDSAANFVLVRMPEHVCPGLKAVLDEAGLVIKFFTEPAFLGFARISLGTTEENARLLAAIETAWPAAAARVAASGDVA